MIKLTERIDRSAATLRFTGIRPERVTALAAQNGIVLRHVRRLDAVTLEAAVPARRVRAMRACAQENGFAVALAGRRGAYYVILRLLRRAALWGGLLLSVLALSLFSRRVWFVRVTGASDEESVRAFFLAEGICDWHSRVDTQALARALTQYDEKYIWCSVSINGALAQVFVKEKTLPPAETEQAALLVARKDCLIRNLIVLKGRALVKNGQTVRAGEALIAPETIGGVTYAPEGRAIAGVYYTASLFMPKVQTVSSPTGRTQEITALDLFGVSLPRQAPAFAAYRTHAEHVETFGLPLGVTRIVLEEMSAREIVYEEEEAVREAEAALTKRLETFLPGDAPVVSSKTAVAPDEDGWLITVTIQTIEEVAVKGSAWDL